MKRSVTGLSLLGACLLTVVGCSDRTVGNPTPSLPGTSAAGDSSSKSPEPTGSVSIAALDPCTVLSPPALAKYGTFRDSTPKGNGGARSCFWQKDRGSASGENLGIAVDIRDSQGIDSVNDTGSGKQTGEVNGRSGVSVAGAGDCTLALAVSPTSRVDVGVVTADTNMACKIANEVAYLVEPKLPKA